MHIHTDTWIHTPGPLSLLCGILCSWIVNAPFLITSFRLLLSSECDFSKHQEESQLAWLITADGWWGCSRGQSHWESLASSRQRESNNIPGAKLAPAEDPLWPLILDFLLVKQALANVFTVFQLRPFDKTKVPYITDFPFFLTCWARSVIAWNVPAPMKM